MGSSPILRIDFTGFVAILLSSLLSDLSLQSFFSGKMVVEVLVRELRELMVLVLQGIPVDRL